MAVLDPNRSITDLNTEFIRHDWTTKSTMTELLDEYNESSTTLRKKEFAYQSWIQKFWGENEADQFESFMKYVREFDSSIHSLNNEFEEMNIKAESQEVSRETNMHTHDKTRHLMYKTASREWGVKT